MWKFSVSVGSYDSGDYKYYYVHFSHPLEVLGPMWTVPVQPGTEEATENSAWKLRKTKGEK